MPVNRLLLAAVAGALLAGCTKRESEAAAALRTQTLRVGNYAEPRDLDPQVLTLATDFNIALALFEGLTVDDDATARPMPGVASSWDISPDRLVYTFHLRPDARWSNGDPVTAEDFAWSFQRMLSPAFAAEYAYMLWPIKNAEAFTSGRLHDFSAVGVKVVDDRTLQLTLEHPTPYLLALAAHNSWMPVHRATLERFGQMTDRNTDWTRPGNLVSNGPFMLEAWTPNSRIVVVKNPHYWNAARNHLNGVVFYPISDPDTEEHAFRAGQLDVTYAIPPEKITAYHAQPDSPLSIEPGLRNVYVDFNTRRPPLDQVKIRRALSLALDRAGLARSVYYGVAAPAFTFTPPGCGDYTPPPGIKEDPAEARRLLVEAGYPGGKGLPVLPLSTVNDPTASALAEAIQGIWRQQLGVESSIEVSEQKVWVANLATHHYAASIYSWMADYPDPTTFLDLLRTDNGNNYAAWSDPAYDALLDRANLAPPAERNRLLRQAETLILQQAPVAPLYFRPVVRLVSPHVKNWTASPLDLHHYQYLELK